jgi:CheY-like chemotaxis protein
MAVIPLASLMFFTASAQKQLSVAAIEDHVLTMSGIQVLGIQVLREIKQSLQAPLVIMLTNYPFGQYRQECIEADADHFLNKSTGFEKINEILKKIVHPN